MLTYKGYAGCVEFDDESGIFHGEVLDLRDVVTFQGKSVKEIEKAFRDSIDEYLAFCEERGEEPDKPFSGRLMLRLPRSYIEGCMSEHSTRARASISGFPIVSRRSAKALLQNNGTISVARMPARADHHANVAPHVFCSEP